MSGLDFTPFLPELVFAGGLLVLLVLDLVVRGNRGIVAAAGGAVLLTLLFFVSLSGGTEVGAYLFGALVQDGVAQFFRLFFILSTLVAIGVLTQTFARDGEPFLLMLASVLGMFILAGANDLVTLFVALEMVSIPSYVLAGYRRQDAKSAEAALKYVLFGAVSSGLMVYGLSLLYGLTGETGLPEIAAALRGGTLSGAAQMAGLVLILIGIGYKIAMVPMHFWCPDVYEGSPTAITAFFSVVPKAAGFAALYRLMPVINTLTEFSGITALGLLTLASAVTMTFGNLGAIWQDSLKRLLAYSSIAHAGYILMGFAVLAAVPEPELHQLAVQAILIYLVVYLFMNLGAFLVVDWVERRLGSDSISAFKGLGKAAPLPALALAVFLFSLTGLPPLAGFIGKFFLFAAVVKGGLWALAMVGIANSVVALFYYVRVIRDMFLHEPEPELATASANPHLKLGMMTAILAVATVVPTLVLGVWWGGLAEWIASKI